MGEVQNFFKEGQKKPQNLNLCQLLQNIKICLAKTEI